METTKQLKWRFERSQIWKSNTWQPKQPLIAIGVQNNVCKKHMDSHLISVFANHEILPSYLMPHHTLALEF
jgi:hypothetical protein